MSKLGWYLRQLFPLTYRSRYADANGQNRFVVWRMWFGKCFSIDDVALA